MRSKKVKYLYKYVSFFLLASVFDSSMTYLYGEPSREASTLTVLIASEIGWGHGIFLTKATGVIFFLSFIYGIMSFGKYLGLKDFTEGACKASIVTVSAAFILGGVSWILY